MNKEAKRLIINLVIVGIIITIGILIYFLYFKKQDPKLLIDETPIYVESIKTIAEISTVSYRDEVVMDTVEMTQDEYDIYDPRAWKSWYDAGVKRRLTLIIKGEVNYGLDLTNNNYSLESGKDTIRLMLPQPKLLNVIITPSETIIFEEKGEWKDDARRILETKAKVILKENAKNLDFQNKAKENALRLFEKLIQTKKVLIIEFKGDE